MDRHQQAGAEAGGALSRQGKAKQGKGACLNQGIQKEGQMANGPGSRRKGLKRNCLLAAAWELPNGLYLCRGIGEWV